MVGGVALTGNLKGTHLHYILGSLMQIGVYSFFCFCNPLIYKNVTYIFLSYVQSSSCNGCGTSPAKTAAVESQQACKDGLPPTSG